MNLYDFSLKTIDGKAFPTENLKGKKFVQRNWELQFLTTDDQEKLTDYLQSKELIHQIDIDLIKDYLNLFYKEDQVHYSHSVSTLLTLSLFFKNVYL